MKLWLMIIAVGVAALVIAVVIAYFYYRPTFEWVQ
jgi:hypothetical protein